MQFTRLISTFIVLLTFGVFALATPAAAKSGNSIETIMTSLKLSITPTLSAINATVARGGANAQTLAPLMGNLVTELNKASGQLHAAKGLPFLAKRQAPTPDQTLAMLITEIVDVLEGIDAAIPGLPPLIAQLDAALAAVVTGLDTLLSGVLNLVGALVGDVSTILTDLGMALSLAALTGL